MRHSKQLRQTEMIELVETHNIALSIRRIKNQSGGYDGDRWKRAVYHALSLCYVGRAQIEKIRVALELP